MKKKNLALALVGVLLLAGSAVVFAGLGEDDDQASDLDVGGGFPDLGNDCICPLYYDPVVCFKQNPDGSLAKKMFSNPCFAGCEGYTRCVRFAVAVR